MFSKLHKSKKINEIIEIKRTEYIQIDEDEDILTEGVLYNTATWCAVQPKLKK